MAFIVVTLFECNNRILQGHIFIMKLKLINWELLRAFNPFCAECCNNVFFFIVYIQRNFLSNRLGNSGQLDLFLVVECGDWFPTLFLNGHLSSKSFCRLPSPFNKGSKCPTITNPSCKDSGSHSNSNLNNSRSSRSTPTSSDRNKAQLNQQNNNVTSGKFKSCSSDNQGML